MQSLQEIRTTLKDALGSDSIFSLINTRIILRTGVDLAAVQPADDRNQEQIGRVLESLTAMGYSLQSLNVVAQKNRK